MYISSLVFRLELSQNKCNEMLVFFLKAKRAGGNWPLITLNQIENAQPKISVGNNDLKFNSNFISYFTFRMIQRRF